MLYIDGRAAGVVEAKKGGAMLVGVEMRSAKYTVGLSAELPAWRRPWPLAYASTGVETRFTNGLEAAPRSRPVFAFHMLAMLGVGVDRRLEVGRRRFRESVGAPSRCKIPPRRARRFRGIVTDRRKRFRGIVQVAEAAPGVRPPRANVPRTGAPYAAARRGRTLARTRHRHQEPREVTRREPPALDDPDATGSRTFTAISFIDLVCCSQ